MKQRLLFLGPPGAGKGTQAQQMAQRHQMLHLSTGGMLRAEVEADTPLGQEVNAVMVRGDLVGDQQVLAIVRARLYGQTAGWLLDGFPRTLVQAEALDSLLDELLQPLELAVLIDIADDLLVQRLLGRGRADDTVDAIANRLSVYQEKTAPLVAFYEQQGLLQRVDGQGTIDEIAARLETICGLTPHDTLSVWEMESSHQNEGACLGQTNVRQVSGDPPSWQGHGDLSKP